MHINTTNSPTFSQKAKKYGLGKQVMSIEKWSTTNIQRWISKPKSMIRKDNKVSNLSQQEKIFTSLSSSSEAKKKNRRIHHIHKLPSSHKLKQRIPLHFTILSEKNSATTQSQQSFKILRKQYNTSQYPPRSTTHSIRQRTHHQRLQTSLPLTPRN